MKHDGWLLADIRTTARPTSKRLRCGGKLDIGFPLMMVFLELLECANDLEKPCLIKIYAKRIKVCAHKAFHMRGTKIEMQINKTCQWREC